MFEGTKYSQHDIPKECLVVNMTSLRGTQRMLALVRPFSSQPHGSQRVMQR